jgi:hypothetical protein
VGVVYLTNASTVPTANPTGGVITYAEAGVLKWRDPSGIVHDLSQASQTPNIRFPSDQGLVAWTFDPLFSTATTTVTNGTVYLAAVRLRSAAIISKIWYIIQTAAVTPTVGQNYIGLYDSTGSLLNATSIDSNLSAVGVNGVALSASQNLGAGVYWVALLVNAATSPGISRAGAQQASALNVNLSTPANYQFATNGTSRTSLTAITPASNSTSGAFGMWTAVS